MRNRHIEKLNQRFGQTLGFFNGEPRFAWEYAPDLYYYVRSETGVNFERRCWAERLGKKWMLCQRRPPTYFDPSTGGQLPLTETMWWQQYHGMLPYPKRGMYVPQPETALMPGLIPDLEDTLGYIYALRRQMDMSLAEHYREGKEQAEAASLDAEKQFYAEADDWFPYGWKGGQAHEPGTRGAHISFGGIEGTT